MRTDSLTAQPLPLYAAGDIATEKVARFFFGNNIAVRNVESTTFKELVQAIRTAPLDWNPPSRKALGSTCLTALARKLRQEEAPLRQSVLQYGGTVMSDGWDSIDREHLINQLVGTSKGVFFDGTVKLGSTDHEDASMVASVFRATIARTGALAVIQLCSDTCNVMKAAWKMIEKEYPWITATPCGTHVLNLELKDIGKIPAIQSVIAKVKLVLSVFGGRSRWPRQRLKETIFANHGGAKWGLYRAKATRFAGNVREMARMLRAKNDLQQIVVSAEYTKREKNINRSRQLVQKAAEQGDQDDNENELDDDEPVAAARNIAGEVKGVLLDESGFWAELVNILRVTHPIVCLLRLMDGNQPCLGDVYFNMFTIKEKMEALADRVSWVPAALRIHDQRWEYLHSHMHAAAYALHPAYMTMAKDIDQHCQTGLFTIIERMMIRDVILKNECDISTPEKLAEVCKVYHRRHPEVVSRTAQCEREFCLYQQGEPPFDREAVKLNAAVVHPHKWWTMYGGHVELLQSVAQRVLGQVAAASAAERNWSIYGQVKNDKALRLTHAHADARVYVHEALQLHEKLNKVEDAHVEEWSDSDSNASDDAVDTTSIEKYMR